MVILDRALSASLLGHAMDDMVAQFNLVTPDKVPAITESGGW